MKNLFRAAGEGSPLVLLHAFPLSATMWDPNFTRLREGNMLVAPHLRGFGGSAAGTTASMDEMADDVAELLDALHIERAAFAGLSMGGYVALAMWRRHRARVSALVLADTRAAGDTAEQKAGRAVMAAEVMKGGAAVAVEKLLPKLLSAGASAAAKGFVSEMILANRPEGIAAALMGMGARADSTPLLATIDVPTLLVCGANDVITPPAEMREVAGKIRGAKYVELAGIGHLSNIEAPQVFSETVSGFLAERA
ncbi:MAG: alpha/beta hydrolase [Planctomycetes bacterium]|nr:alpha/beta hydrolase [Planctomycetota bacterium]